jgi:hypothetical protein
MRGTWDILQRIQRSPVPAGHPLNDRIQQFKNKIAGKSENEKEISMRSFTDKQMTEI